MGIYIKGMEMPTSCQKCQFLFCPGGIKGGRHDDCPLVPVPPHGRLIDAETLWAKINKICDRRDAGIISDLTCLQQILPAVRHTPTIIPAEQEVVKL